jgi:hypothetical protein
MILRRPPIGSTVPTATTVQPPHQRDPGAEQQCACGLGKIVGVEVPLIFPGHDVEIAVAIEIPERRRGVLAGAVPVERIRRTGARCE